MDVSDLFENEPIQWGLRGDPFLWRELKERLKYVKMPDTPEQLRALIEKEYELSTGHSITDKKQFGVTRFRSFGMSSGGISPEFWVTRGIPLLVGRHVKS